MQPARYIFVAKDIIVVRGRGIHANANLKICLMIDDMHSPGVVVSSHSICACIALKE